MPKTTETRKRLLEASAELFRRQGYAGTGLKEITACGEAPWGSLYHFFPGGKEELGAEAVGHSGRRYRTLIDMVYDRAGGDPVRGIGDFFRLSVDALQRSGFANGCPVATVALEAASTSEVLRHACDEAFASWQRATASLLVSRGVSPERAADLATYILAAFEGAVVLSRTAHDTRPLLVTTEIVAATLRRELDE